MYIYIYIYVHIYIYIYIYEYTHITHYTLHILQKLFVLDLDHKDTGTF